MLDGNDAGYGVLGEAQIKWVQETLARARRNHENAILLNHFALLPAAAKHHRMENPEPLRGIINQSGCVVAYFAGHDHAGGYAVDRGVHHVTLQGMVEAPERNAYAVVRVFTDRIEVRGTGKVPSRILSLKKTADHVALHFPGVGAAGASSLPSTTAISSAVRP